MALFLQLSRVMARVVSESEGPYIRQNIIADGIEEVGDIYF